jgi:oxygen-independent coproporphyrinogen-3 oxidase
MFRSLDLLASRVPRYTSYPTAPHFHAGVGANVLRSWLEALPHSTPLSIYLHIPFCDTLCWFCGCHTRVVNTYRPLEDYLGRLAREIDLVASAVGSGRRVTHIQWGGGSPTLIAPSGIMRLADTLRDTFDVDPGCEFSVEIDPRGLSDATVAALAAAGVNRASVGVQDCDASVQRAINRIQPLAVTQSAIERLREAGIESINIDLMYGLPRQTAAGVEQTIRAVLALQPQRLAVFGYAHVPGFKKHQRLIREEDLPSPEERLTQFETARTLLEGSGYDAIGLDHFAKPTDPLAAAGRERKLRRNFQGYTTDTAPALIGLGASAISALPQGYTQNISEVPAWRQALGRNDFATARGIALSSQDRARREIIEQLMCYLETDAGAVAQTHGLPAGHFDAELADVDEYAREGLLAVDGRRIRVRAQARALVRVVSAVFDSYLRAGTARHSIAV